jgi:hypothetical protein
MELLSRYIDETFDLNNCNNYNLSIQFALDGFSFAIFDPVVKKIIVASEYSFVATAPIVLKNSIQSIINNESFLLSSFKKVKAYFSNNKITLAPKALADVSMKNILHDFSHQTERDDALFIKPIDNELIVVFSLPKIVKEILDKFYPNIEYYSSLCPVYNYSKNLSISGRVLCISVSGHNIMLFVKQGSKIEAYNSFFIQNETDALYYILNLIGNFNDNLKTEVLLLGKVNRADSLIYMLKNYFEKIRFAEYASDYNISYLLMNESQHRYVELFELLLCE